MENLERLPKWARDRIAHAEREEAAAKERLAALTAQPTGEPGTIQYGNYLDDERPIPERDTVTFVLGPYRQKIDIRFRDGQVEVMGTDRLVIEPNASNVVHLSLVKR